MEIQDLILFGKGNMRLNIMWKSGHLNLDVPSNIRLFGINKFSSNLFAMRNVVMNIIFII
jgi:hypothetical protein